MLVYREKPLSHHLAHLPAVWFVRPDQRYRHHALMGMLQLLGIGDRQYIRAVCLAGSLAVKSGTTSGVRRSLRGLA